MRNNKGPFDYKRLLPILADAIVLFVTVVLSYFFWVFLTGKQDIMRPELPLYLFGFIGCGILGMSLAGSYRTFYMVGYISDFVRCILGFLAGEIALLLVCIIGNKGIYIQFTTVSLLIGLFALIMERMLYYLLVKKFLHFLESRRYPATLIIGAGDAGRTVLSEIKRSKTHKYRVVGFVDDDPKKISTVIDTIHVYGPTVLIPELCAKYRVEEIIFAIPTCPEEKKQQILKSCSATKCNIKIVPSLFELNRTGRVLSQVKSINVEDLLGRDVIRINDPGLADFLNNKVVFVTGVGSIGSELCRQIVRFGPKKLVMIDIYENNAYDIQQELIRSGYGNLISTEIASVRDYDKMKALFKAYRPQIVFHAAAHKHVPLMEDNPEEAIKNNVFGTYNVARLAAEFKAAKMVLISTDKAVNPTNVMGASKRCCEMVMQYMAQTRENTEYVAVRFGNVLGSNGSVIPLFSKQIEAGGPVTVTHPDIIRYFMTIPEAVSLVLESGNLAKGGEIFVLDMGEPVKITTLAENLIRLYGYEPYTEMPIKFVGLRPGEKLFEELLMSEEGLKSTANKKIFIGKQIEIDIPDFEKKLEAIGKSAGKNDKKTTVELLHEIVPTFSNEKQDNNNDKN